jgi:hypothetical protein
MEYSSRFETATDITKYKTRSWTGKIKQNKHKTATNWRTLALNNLLKDTTY